MAEKTRSKWHPGSILASFKRFFLDQRSEMKKIVWPSKKQVKNNTAIVLAFVALSAVLVGGFDYLLGMLVNLLLGR